MTNQTQANKGGSKERNEVLRDLEKLSLRNTEEDRQRSETTSLPTPSHPRAQADQSLSLGGEIWHGRVNPNLACLIRRCSCPRGTCQRRPRSLVARMKMSRP